MYTLLLTYTHSYIFTYTYTYTHIYIHTYMHTCIYTHIYTIYTHIFTIYIYLYICIVLHRIRSCSPYSCNTLGIAMSFKWHYFLNPLHPTRQKTINSTPTTGSTLTSATNSTIKTGPASRFQVTHTHTHTHTQRETKTGPHV